MKTGKGLKTRLAIVDIVVIGKGIYDANLDRAATAAVAGEFDTAFREIAEESNYSIPEHVFTNMIVEAFTGRKPKISVLGATITDV